MANNFDPIPHLKKIRDQLNHLLGVPCGPHHAVLRDDKLLLFGYEVGPGHLQWTPEEREVNSWRRVATGRMRLRVAGPPSGRRRAHFPHFFGPVPDYRSFAPLKDGTYNYVDIAARLKEWQWLYTSWLKMEETKKSNSGLITALRDELGRLPAGVVIEESWSADTPVIVRVSVGRNLTVDQARSFVAKLRKVL